MKIAARIQIFFLLVAFLVTAALATPVRGADPAAPGPATSGSEKAESADGDPGAEEPRIAGISMGSYYLKDFRPISGQKTKFTFELYAVVDAEHEKRLRPIFERRAKRIYDQVITAVRLSEDEDFEDPNLTRMRRRMKFRLQRAMPELEFDDIYFTEFRYYVD